MVILNIILLVLVVDVGAQTPEPTRGWMKYGLGFSLIPQGEERQLADQSGQAYRLFHSAQLVDLALQGSYRFSPEVTLHIELGTQHHFRQIRVEKATGSHTNPQMESAYQMSWWSSGRFVFQQEKIGRIQPQWSFTVGYPWVLKIDTGFNITGDPVVLSGTLRYEMQPVEWSQTVSVHCGVGLVANESVSIMLSAQHSILLQAVHVPRSTVLLGVTYLWDGQTGREVSVQNVLETAGGQIHAGLRTQVHVKNADLL